MDVKFLTAPVEVKDAEAGEVSAAVATVGVVDKDGDVILPTVALDGKRVLLSAFGHDVVTENQPPVGRGSVAIEGKRIVFDGSYFLGTARGREAFETVKALGPDSEWSFGFRVTDTRDLTDEWRRRGARRLLSGLKVLEASPVFQGAGIGTGTVETRSRRAIAAKAAGLHAYHRFRETVARYGDVAGAAASAELAAEQELVRSLSRCRKLRHAGGRVGSICRRHWDAHIGL